MRTLPIIATLALGLTPLFVTQAQAQAPAPTTAPAATAAAPQALTFVVKFRAKPGKNAEMEKVFREAQQGVRDHEPGNVAYDFFVLATDPQTYVIIERYKDQAAVQAHGSSEHGRKLIAGLRDLMDGSPQADRLVLISSKQ